MKVGVNYRNLHLYVNNSDITYMSLSTAAGKNDSPKLSGLPKTPGSKWSLYPVRGLNSRMYVSDLSSPVVIFECLEMNEPTWTWSGTSATAVFTAKDASASGVCVTRSASVTSSAVNATKCTEKSTVTYTASVTFAGKTYTTTKTDTGEAGPHSYSYSASGNVITETCKNGCGHSETATLSLDTSASLAYSGDAITPLKVTYSNGWQGETLTVSYSNNINPGTAKGSITIGGATATETFEISNGTLTGITANGYSGEYDGEYHYITVNAPDGTTVTYSTDGITYTSTNPGYAEKGSYTVYYKVEKNNYNTVTGYSCVDISQAANSWKTEPSIENRTYGQAAGTPNTGTPEFGSVTKVEYKSATANDSEYSTDVPTQAGDYKVRFTVVGTDNYAGLEKVVEFKIEKVKLTVKAKDNSKTYGENDPDLTWEITNGALVNSEKLTCISITRESGENAKTYAITVSQNVGANSNYDITFVGGTFTINKKTIGIDWSNTSFTYDGGTKIPTATPTGVADGDSIELTVGGEQTHAGTDYTATVTGITGAQAGNYKLPENVTTKFSIAKANRLPTTSIQGKAETIYGKNDGEIIGVSDLMEYRKSDENTYSDVGGSTIKNLAAGTYYVRYKATDDYNESSPDEVVIEPGQKLTVTIPTKQTGYTLTVDKTKLEWEDDVKLTFTLAEGYSKLDSFAVKVNGSKVTLNGNGEYTVSKAQKNVNITVEGVADITAPTAEVKIGNNVWNGIWSNLTSGQFYKDAQKVEITAEDNGSGVDRIYYYLAAKELSTAQVEALSDSDWTTYTAAFNINPEAEYVVYAKVTDKANNIAYFNSDGIILDSIAPVISDVVDGETYYGNTTFTVTDEHIDVVKVDGEPVTLTAGGKYTITADGNEHTVVAADKSGNSSREIKITVITIASLDDEIEGIDESNVTSENKEDIQEVLDFVNELIDSGKDFTESEKEQLKAIKDNAKKLLDKLDEVDKAVNTDSVVKTGDITSDNVTTDDKSDLETAKSDLKKALENYRNNLTDDEIKDIEDAIKRIDNALEVIERVKNVEEIINNLPDKITKDDASAVKGAKAAYNGLSEYEQSILDKDAKKKLDKANAMLDALNKASSAPKTGDVSSLPWLAVFFVSGGVLAVMAAFERKKKQSEAE